MINIIVYKDRILESNIMTMKIRIYSPFFTKPIAVIKTSIWEGRKIGKEVFFNNEIGLCCNLSDWYFEI